MLTVLLVVVFVLGYLAIMFEHNIQINKSASALVIGALCWTLLALLGTHGADAGISAELGHHVGEIASILFFLMGAMTIVELIDAYDGFDLITDRITTRSATRLLWIICLLAFFLSAILDNLTTTIVMVTLVRKLVADTKTRLLFVGLIVIAANAGGAWSPMGDVTTTMLWIGGQISAVNIMKQLLLPSFISLLIPLIITTFPLRGQNLATVSAESSGHSLTNHRDQWIILLVGLGGLVFVPLFKTLTHLPPFMGMLLSLGVLWIVTESILKRRPDELRNTHSVQRAIERMDMPSVLFFLGILLAVSALQSGGLLHAAADWLVQTFKNETLIVTLIGLLSAIIDNVPLVAAAMGMYSLEQFPQDHPFWELLAFCAGTGGSALIIGSAAGVAAMGLEEIDFFWYLKRISWLALIGYFAGIGIFLLQAYFVA